MLRTGGTVAVSIGALLTAGSMNLAVLNGGPSGPGNLVIRAAAAPTTAPRPHGEASGTTTTGATSSTTAARRHLLRADVATTTAPGSTTTSPSTTDPATTTSTRPPSTTTTTQPQTDPQGGRLFTVRTAGHVRVHWVNGRTISAVALPNDGWSLPHTTKQGPDVTLRFQSTTQLVVWHAWVEAHQIKAWIHTYRLGS